MRKNPWYTRIIYGMAGILLLSSCYKDKGNYDIAIPAPPQLTGLDTLYEAVVGDSLIIEPEITGIDPASLQCNWRIDVPEAIDPDANHYEGKALRMVFGLQARRYRARLTVTNLENGMKYFYNFRIQGITEFSRGSLVLSVDVGQTKLSFIKPDGTVQPNIYEAINNEPLPELPLSIDYLYNQFTGNTPLGYWIVTKHDGVRLDVNNLKKEAVKPGTLRDNFFLAPAEIEVGSLQAHPQGVLMGVINGKFYGGTTSTWDQSNTYGMFGTYADGQYTLAPSFVLRAQNNSFSMVAYDTVKKQFVRLNLYGAPMFFGTQYTPVNTAIFDPTNVGMDLLKIVQINQTDVYAYMKDAQGMIYELKFNINFNGPFTVTAVHKRPFVRPEWIQEDTKMLTTRNGNMYIAFENQVFRYNPINEQVQALATDFPAAVTLLKAEDDENTLIVGAGTSLYYLAIQPGKNGDLVRQINGIPGYPVDITWRK